jgi:hypothetical protein
LEVLPVSGYPATTVINTINPQTTKLINSHAATSGATLRELMDRVGHTSSWAALIYLHGSDERQQTIANAISEQARKHLPRGHGPATEGSAQEKHRARNGHGSRG